MKRIYLLLAVLLINVSLFGQVLTITTEPLKQTYTINGITTGMTFIASEVDDSTIRLFNITTGSSSDYRTTSNFSDFTINGLNPSGVKEAIDFINKVTKRLNADVNIQEQTTEVIDLFLHRTLNLFTIASSTIINTNTFEADPGHLIVAGNTLCFLEGKNFSQFTVLDVTTNTITVDSPFDKVYTTSGTYQHHTPNMSVDGSITPQVYFIKPIPGIKYDITRIVIVIEDELNMDFSTFGSIPGGITNGCVLRKKDGFFKNLFNWKTNGDFISRSFDFGFQTNIGNNLRAFTARTTYSGQSKRGVVIRLDGDLGDELQVIIQDDLSSQTRIIMIAQGHIVED